MKIKGKMLGLLVAGSLVLGTTGALAADNMAQSRANTTNYSAKKAVSIKTDITLEKAKQIALKDAKSGSVTRAHLDKENGIWVFEVEVVDGNVEKDYTIHANTGKILEIEVEIDRNLYVPNKNNKPNNQNTVTKNTVSANDAKITMDKAKEIALKAAKSGQITKVELDRDYGILVYEIEVLDGNTEYEYKIDAVTGKIVKTDIETKRVQTPQTQSPKTNQSTNSTIGMEKAKQIAMNHAKTGKVTKVELDREYGILVYEIEVRDGRVEKDYKINAQTGEIVKSKVEVDDNDHDNDRFDDDRFDDDDDDRFDDDDDRFDDDDDKFDDDDYDDRNNH